MSATADLDPEAPEPAPGPAPETPSSLSNLIPRLVVSLILIGAVLFGGRMAFGKLKALKPQTQRATTATLPILVRATSVTRQDYPEILRGYGVSRALRRTQAVALMEGRVKEVATELEVGDRVRVGPKNGSGSPKLPVLVKLDDRDIRDRVKRANLDVTATRLEIERLGAQKKNLEIQLKLAREERATAQREYERIVPLVPKSLSPSDLDRQRLQVTLQERRIQTLTASIEDNDRQVKVAEARVEAAVKTVELETRHLEWTVIHAPAEGLVHSRAVEPWDFVRRGDVLFELVDLSIVEVPISLSASRYDDVRAGSPVTLFDPVTNRELWRGTVKRRAPSIDTSSRTFLAYVEIEGSPYANPIPPGRHVRAEVRGRTESNVFVVPRQAFLDGKLFVARKAEPTIWTPQRRWLQGLPHTENTIYAVDVRTPKVARWLPGVALVSAGLTDGDKLLLTNLESIGDGGSVRFTLEPKPAAQDD